MGSMTAGSPYGYRPTPYATKNYFALAGAPRLLGRTAPPTNPNLPYMPGTMRHPLMHSGPDVMSDQDMLSDFGAIPGGGMPHQPTMAPQMPTAPAAPGGGQSYGGLSPLQRERIRSAYRTHGPQIAQNLMNEHLDMNARRDAYLRSPSPFLAYDEQGRMVPGGSQNQTPPSAASPYLSHLQGGGGLVSDWACDNGYGATGYMPNKTVGGAWGVASGEPQPQSMFDMAHPGYPASGAMPLELHRWTSRVTCNRWQRRIPAATGSAAHCPLWVTRPAAACGRCSWASHRHRPTTAACSRVPSMRALGSLARP